MWRTVAELSQEVADIVEERVVLEYQLDQLKSFGNQASRRNQSIKFSASLTVQKNSNNSSHYKLIRTVCLHFCTEWTFIEIFLTNIHCISFCFLTFIATASKLFFIYFSIYYSFSPIIGLSYANRPVLLFPPVSLLRLSNKKLSPYLKRKRYLPPPPLPLSWHVVSTPTDFLVFSPLSFLFL